MPPTGRGDVSRPIAVDRERDALLRLRTVDGVVRGAVEDHVRPSMRDHRLHRGGVSDVQALVIQAGVRTQQTDELETELARFADDERFQSDASPA